MRFVKSALLATTLISATANFAQADIKVVASIKPVHSLVAAVMQGAGTPDLIVKGAGSPHTYALKPSQASELENADVVFWVGHQLEAFLEKPIEAIATKAKAVELIDAHDLVKLEFREGGAFDGHDHGSHAGEEHDDPTKEKHDDHDHDEHAKDKHDDHDHEEHAKDKHEGHAHEEGGFDPHVWLDPLNAKALVHEIEEALVKADPDNSAKYEENAHAVMKKLDGLVGEISAELASVQGKKFVVFHDAYQNFEKRFELSAIGSITVSPEVMPGAERVSALRAKVKNLSAVCVFSEPQFEPKLVATVVEGTSAKTGVLDPLGTLIKDGPELYFELIRNMATSFKACLSEAS